MNQIVRTYLFKNMENIMKDTTISDVSKTINFIKEVVAAYYGISKDIYNLHSRKAEDIKVKHFAIYICKKQIKISSVALGNAFKLDHSTVIYIEKKFNGYLEWDLGLRKELKEIENILKFKVADELNLEKEYYYIPLNDFVSIKHKDGKAIILKGFTEKEIEAMKFVDNRSGKEFFDEPNEIKKHTNQKFYILEKKENEKDNG
jgi:hypothetical protein